MYILIETQTGAVKIANKYHPATRDIYLDQDNNVSYFVDLDCECKVNYNSSNCSFNTAPYLTCRGL
jgi:hypothetical protein